MCTAGIAQAYLVGDLEEGNALTDLALAQKSKLRLGMGMQRLGETMARRSRVGLGEADPCCSDEPQ